jgi:phosphoglycerate dehydrogenase-like enzyme
MIERGDWQVSEIARDAFDLEGKVVGTIGAGRIGYRSADMLDIIQVTLIVLRQGSSTSRSIQLQRAFVLRLQRSSRW